MNLTLKKVSIDNFLKDKKISWNLKQVNVLVGKNGTGKTSLLKIIDTMLTTHDETLSSMRLSGKIEISVKEKEATLISNKMLLDFKVLDQMVTVLTDERFANSINKTAENKVEIRFNVNESETVINEEKIHRFAQILAKDEAFRNKRYTSLVIKENDENISFDEYVKNFKVEFISTVNLSSNSISQYIGSDGNTKSTILDIEIEKEVLKLNKKGKKENLNKLISAINVFFEESKKKIDFDGDDFLIVLNNGDEIKVSELSSGERQLLYIFLKVINNPPNTIFLMDEPEISLHLEWQEKLISEIIKISPHCQLIIVTHSPAIVMNGWMDSYIDINDIIVD